jgi:hypothetical protein
MRKINVDLKTADLRSDDLLRITRLNRKIIIHYLPYMRQIELYELDPSIFAKTREADPYRPIEYPQDDGIPLSIIHHKPELYSWKDSSAILSLDKMEFDIIDPGFKIEYKSFIDAIYLVNELMQHITEPFAQRIEPLSCQISRCTHNRIMIYNPLAIKIPDERLYDKELITDNGLLTLIKYMNENYDNMRYQLRYHVKIIENRINWSDELVYKLLRSDVDIRGFNSPGLDAAISRWFDSVKPVISNAIHNDITHVIKPFLVITR